MTLTFIVGKPIFEFCAAVLGTTMITTAAPLTATGTIQITITTILGFVSLGPTIYYTAGVLKFSILKFLKCAAVSTSCILRLIFLRQIFN